MHRQRLRGGRRRGRQGGQRYRGARCNQRDDDRRNIIEKLIISSRGRLRRGKRKVGLIKNNLERNEDAMSSEIHASITLMMRRKTKKNASASLWGIVEALLG
jgi:hypothetical protein